MSVNKFPFEDRKGMIRKIQRQTAIKMVNNAKRFFDNSFKNEGWTDTGLKKWPKSRRARMFGDKTLSDTGALRRSIKPTQISFKRSVIQTVGIPYARRHNEGLKKMTKRQFMGDSKQLRKETADLIAKEFLKVFLS